MKRWLLLSVAVLAPLATTAAANARPASTGFFAEGGLGGLAVIPKRNVDVGPSITLRVGRDLFSWLSLGVFLGASSHQATVPPPPEDEWFQIYRGGADARIGGLAGSVAFFAEGGIGVGIMSSNILEKVMILTPGQRYSVMFHGGGGLEYQLENRHYALGAAVDAFVLPQFDNIKAIDTRIYLRYTYGGG